MIVFIARYMDGGFDWGTEINLVDFQNIDPHKIEIKRKYVATFKKEVDFYSN